jgi:predicted lipoprotein with Yx(FWY)xxD motif
MKRASWCLFTFLFVSALGAVAPAQSMPSGVKVTKMGGMSMLTDAKGMTLYTRDSDTKGKSTCSGVCTKNWPPLTAKAGDKPVGPYTIVTRDDGTKQWAYHGKPLYRWKNDKKAGDMTGDGVGGQWHAAKP